MLGDLLQQLYLIPEKWHNFATFPNGNGFIVMNDSQKLFFSCDTQVDHLIRAVQTWDRILKR